jgi:hypothetical protein
MCLSFPLSHAYPAREVRVEDTEPPDIFVVELRGGIEMIGER